MSRPTTGLEKPCCLANHSSVVMQLAAAWGDSDVDDGNGGGLSRFLRCGRTTGGSTDKSTRSGYQIFLSPFWNH